MRRHQSIEFSAHERGLGFGRAQADAVAVSVAHYERAFAERGYGREDLRSVGGELGRRLGGLYPDLVEEIAGIAEGAGQEVEMMLAVNARTELLGGEAECSMVGVLPERTGGPTLLAQNWDWHPPLAGACVLWEVIGPDGRWFTTVTEAGMLAKVGLNDRGLGVCLNRLRSSIDGGVDGVPVHVLLRLLLERCDDLPQASRLLNDARASASSCISVADGGQASMRAFEVSPRGVAEVLPEAGVLLHTNHFLHPVDGAVDLNRGELPDTVARLDELEESVRRGPARVDADAVKRALSSHRGGSCGVCRHPAPGAANETETIFAILLSLDDREMEVSDGAPCSTPFERVTPPTRAEVS
jgi:isopenicillin-N N-acyltransferase-like protein